MENTIKVYWSVSITSGTENLSLDYLDCETIEEWDSLDEDEQMDRIQSALDELPERVSIVADEWHKKRERFK